MKEILESTEKEIIRISHLVNSNTATKKELLRLAVLSELVDRINRMNLY